MFNKYIREVGDENNDRADIQEQSLKKHLSKNLESLNNVLRGHRERGRNALSKATEGKISALKYRIDRKIQQVNKGRILKYHRTTSCLGVISLEASP